MVLVLTPGKKTNKEKHQPQKGGEKRWVAISADSRAEKTGAHTPSRRWRDDGEQSDNNL